MCTVTHTQSVQGSADLAINHIILVVDVAREVGGQELVFIPAHANIPGDQQQYLCVLPSPMILQRGVVLHSQVPSPSHRLPTATG